MVQRADQSAQLHELVRSIHTGATRISVDGGEGDGTFREAKLPIGGQLEEGVEDLTPAWKKIDTSRQAFRQRLAALFMDIKQPLSMLAPIEAP